MHREPTFEELLRQRDPTVHVPIRSAWELRNSPFMSVFDAEWLQGAGNPGFLDHLHDEGDQLAQNRTMQEFFRQAGVPYRAQGTDGGPPPSIPPSLGGTLAGPDSTRTRCNITGAWRPSRRCIRPCRVS